jgi:hypothetical protein
VPPAQYPIIDVALKLGWETNNGEVHADFATNEFDVMCPFVTPAIPRLAIEHINRRSHCSPRTCVHPTQR